MDGKTKEKQAQLTDMVRGFCDEMLDEEYGNLCIRLVEKLARKRDVPFRRGKLENWASGVVYAIAQINFLFDASFEPHLTADDICDYFNTKKSTASNKARDIRRMFGLDVDDSEFLASDIRASMPRMVVDEATGFIIPEEFLVKSLENPELEVLMDEINESGDYISEELNDAFLTVIVNSTLLCPPFTDCITFLQTECGDKFFAFFTCFDEFEKTFPEIPNPMLFKFYDFCEMVGEIEGKPDFEGARINPDSQDLFFSFEMMRNVYEMFD